MNDKSHSAVNTLIDHAVNKAIQAIDNSIPQAVIHGAKLIAGTNGNPSAELSPIVGALACDFDACISPWVEAIRHELHEAAAMRLLHRADRHADREPARTHRPVSNKRTSSGEVA